MKRLIPLLALPFLLAFYPGGEPEFFVWEEPTTRVDGSPLAPAADISVYILRCSKDNVANVFNQPVAVGGQNRWDVPQGTFSEGTWVCALYARDQEAVVVGSANKHRSERGVRVLARGERHANPLSSVQYHAPGVPR